MKSKRGYWGIAIYHPKKEINLGTTCRTAHILGASFVAVIGKRFRPQNSDTLKSYRHMPYFEYDSFDAFLAHRPYNCPLVAIEMTPTAKSLKGFVHPERAVYLLGAEDHGIPEHILKQCQYVVKLDGERSLNVATAGSIVFYHRTSL